MRCNLSDLTIASVFLFSFFLRLSFSAQILIPFLSNPPTSAWSLTIFHIRVSVWDFNLPHMDLCLLIHCTPAVIHPKLLVCMKFPFNQWRAPFLQQENEEASSAVQTGTECIHSAGAATAQASVITATRVISFTCSTFISVAGFVVECCCILLLWVIVHTCIHL